MKTLLYIGTLSVSLGAWASPSDPAIQQYWLDNDIQSRFANTRVYDPSSNQVTFEVGKLSEGGHAFHYRMATKEGDKVMWGHPVTNYFFVPTAEENKDKSNSVPTAYRLFLNDKVVEMDVVPNASSFTLTPDFPENFILSSVSSRDFKYLLGEKRMSMTAHGRISYAVQLMSDQKEWGAPFYLEVADQKVETKLNFDSIAVPGRYKFDKVDNNNFKAYRLRSLYRNADEMNVDYVYIQVSQDCRLSLYRVAEYYESNLYNIDSYDLKKGETRQISVGYDSDVFAVFYDTPTDKKNTTNDIEIDIMLENHKVPTPLVSLNQDTWEVTMSCPDPRATIWYTLDGKDPTDLNNGESRKVYTGPISLDKKTRVLAYAVMDDWYGYEASDKNDKQYGLDRLVIPTPELKFAGGLENNEFEFDCWVEDATIYYTFGDNDLDDEGLRTKFDGHPFKIEDGQYLKYFAEKKDNDGKDIVGPSTVTGRYVYLNDYVTRTPEKSSTTYEGEDLEWYSSRKEKVSLYVPEGTAYYRIVSGRQTFNPSEEIDKDNGWTEYNTESNEGWIELPGGANSGNQTLQVFAELKGKARSSVADIYTDWVRAKNPKVDYNNYQVKLSTDVPGGVIKYYYGYYSSDNDSIYTAEKFPDGINVKDQWLVHAYVQSEGYSDSNHTRIERDSYNLSRPNIQYGEDGLLHITHDDDDPNLQMVIDIKSHSNEYRAATQVASNHFTYDALPNDTVRAYVTKYGRNNSEVSEMTPFYRPSIDISGYNVYINWGYSGEIYYTLDGTLPTKESNHYDGSFEVDKACTVRAVAYYYYDGYIPSEAEPQRVLDQAEKPVVKFNYSVQNTEEGPVEVKKIYLESSTPGAKIYYTLDRSLNDDSRKLYNPSWDEEGNPDVDWAGLDVGDANYLYAYAEADNYRRSEEISVYMRDGYLSSPNIEMEGDTIRIWHSDKTVKIVPRFRVEDEDWDYTPEDLVYISDDETNEVKCTVKHNTNVFAKVEKTGYIASDENYKNHVERPTININGSYVSIDNYYWRDQVYYTLDGTVPTKESTRYEGSFYAEPCTVNAVAFRDNEIPAMAKPAQVLPQVAKPKVVYSFDRSQERKKIKFTSDTPNAKFYYALNESLYDENRKEYDIYSDGIDVTDKSYVYVYAEADGYRRSEELFQYFDDAYLSTPYISVQGDGNVTVSHNDPSVKLSITFYDGKEYYTPEDLTTSVEDGTQYAKATVKYNTVVTARAEKEGYWYSDDYKVEPIQAADIQIDGYNVWFYSPYWDSEVYYTLDGTMPTRQSHFYDGNTFTASAGTVRAVTFYDGSIPAESVSATVMDQTETPQVVFNFSKQDVDGETKEIKKVKFACATPNAKIYYSLDRSINDNSRKLYDPAVDPDGIDVADNSYVYAYAEADGYRRSNETDRVYFSSGYLSRPNISVNNGVLTIRHDDPTVTIVPVFTPAQEYTYDAATNTVTCNVAYNTIVKAHATKQGHIDSDVETMNPIYKPTINVDGYYVYIDYAEGEIYYTVDGTMPTKNSIPYTGGFESTACTIRAAALTDYGISSEADPARVLDQAAMPEIEIENGYAKLSSSVAGATIYYSTNVAIANGTRKVYDPTELPNGIDLTDVRTINSYVEANDFRRSETLNFSKSEYSLAAPYLTYANGYVTAEHDDDNVTVVFTDGEGKTLTPEADNPRRVKAPYNTTINAYVSRKGYISSNTVSVKHTDAPTITADLFKITIKGKSGQTLRYTLDGTQPTSKSAEYTEPFSLTASCKVRAAAFVDDLIPSEGTAVDITYRKSQKPQVSSYDGRYLTLSAEEGSSIRYIHGSTGDPELGTVANGKIDMEGLQMVRAIAQRSDADDSDVFSYTPEYYANETDAYSSKPGALKDAFGWISDKSGYTSLNVHGTLLGASTEDSGDYEFLRSMPNLRHLDLSNVTDEAIPAAAFDSKLISVALPTSLKTAGENVFGEDNTTLCSVELPAYANAPENLLDGVQNPNLLLYVKSSNYVTDLLAKAGNVVTNVVVLGTVGSSNRAESVTLTHAKAFYAPKEFNAQKISFTRAFTKETQIGGFGSGWETMVVPFDVQSIVCGDKTLKPFGEANTDRGECPFWLFSAGETDWMTAYSLMANTPYLLAMPNNPLYADEFVINGNVEFSSNNVTVPVTPEEEEMTYSFGTGKYIAGNYALIDKEENVLAINDETVTPNNTTYQPGGVFIAGQKDVVPFECYVLNSGASAIPVFDQNAIDQLLEDYGTRVWGENYCIYVRSSISMKVRVYDSVGQLIRSVDVKAGETVQISDITPGIYFVGSTKILVKG